MTKIDPDEVGAWQGDKFVLHEPITIHGQTFHSIDCTGATFGPGITREDVVHAMLNPIRPPISTGLRMAMTEAADIEDMPAGPVADAIDAFLADPSTGRRFERPQRPDVP